MKQPVPLTQRLLSFAERVTCQLNVWFAIPFNIMDFTVVVNAKIKTSARGHMHAFPFNADDIKGEKRTSTGFMEDAKQGNDCGKPINGIKGPCWLAALKY